MTATIVSLALLLNPSPITAPKEAPSWQPTVISAPLSPTTSSWLFPPPELIPYLFVETPPPASIVSSQPSPTPPPPPEPVSLDPIEAGLNRLVELGANPYQLRVFGCLGWFESRNNQYAVSATGDYGWLQINARYHRWRWAGRDIFDTVVNAEVAWDIYRESGFRAWTTARLCV